ncbi:MAG: TlpA disulfide reductase family protein, partial [Desulfobacterales bacterium]
EMPSMEKLYRKFKGDKSEIFAASIDASGYKAVAPFMKELNLTFPALLDPQGTTQRQYRTTGVPESFIIDSNGILVRRIIGPLDWASPEVVKMIGDLIAGA